MALLLAAALLTLPAGCGGDGGDEAGDSTSLPAATVVDAAIQPTAAEELAAAATQAGEQFEPAMPDATPTPDPGVEEALAIVQRFDPASEDALHQLNTLAFPDGQTNPADIVPALAPLLVDDDPDRRWAALYVVALVTDTPEEIKVLRGALDDPEPAYRVQAAGSLAGLGVVEALPVLIEGLAADWDMPYSDPPRPVSAHARVALEHYTGQTFQDQAGWQGWWEQVEGSLRWDGERYVTG